MTKREQQYLDRYAQALATTRIWNEDYAGELSIFGTCPSTSGEPDVYIISINAQTLYSTGCTCKGGQNGLDCIHRTAADQLLSECRSEMKRQEQRRLYCEEAEQRAMHNTLNDPGGYDLHIW